MSTIHACWLNNRGNSDALITSMLVASDYWSPDAYSQHSATNHTCTLAKAALFNTALSQSDQVYYDQQAGIAISAHARLDNRQALIERLTPKRQNSHSITDGQLILYAYMRWGEACPQYLLGDFVFIIWDERQQKLFCARDHFGVKVLFYSQNDHGIMVTNEHNAFFATHWQPKAIKEKWLVDRLWGLGPTPFESPYQNIAVLPAAHFMVMDEHGLRIQRYWQLEDKNNWQGLDDETLIAELKNRFQTALEKRLGSVYPLGVELSEGLDSNGIAGFAARMSGNKPVYTFSYDCERLTESNAAIWEETYQDIFKMLAMHDNLLPVWHDPTPGIDLADQAKQAFYGYFGAVTDTTAGAHPIRSALAQQQGIRTLLSGWGGDHCVSSYGDFYESELLKRGKLFAVHQLFKGKHHRGRCPQPLKAWILLLVKELCPPLFRYRFQYRNGLERAMLERAQAHFLRDEYVNAYQCNERLKHFLKNYRRQSVKSKDWLELFDIGLENRLVVTELTARQYRLEYRFPMLDVPLVEFAYNLPGHLKIYQGIERYAFRCILEKVTTPRIQWRSKADIAFPAIDRTEAQQQRMAQLKRRLENSELANHYSNRRNIDRFTELATGPMLRNLTLLADLDRQKQLEPISIVATS